MSRQKQRTRVFVGCEGASERAYVRWIQEIAEQESLRLHFDAQIAGGGDPLAVVEESIIALKKRERAQGAFAVRAVLLDKDKIGLTPLRDQKIPALASTFQLTLIFQEWEHEALLLRHYSPSRNLRPPPGSSRQILRGHWPTYSKPADALGLRRAFASKNLKVAMSVEPELRAFLNALGFFP